MAIELAPLDEHGGPLVCAAQLPPSFTEKSYYLGTNIPGKPRRYLLNTGGRQKLREISAFNEYSRDRA